MLGIALVLVLVGDPSSTELAKQSRACFSKLIELKVKDDLLVVEPDPKGGLGVNMSEFVRSSFPSVGRVYVRSQNGSSSSSRGGTGSVNIQYQASGNAGQFRFQLDGGGTESVLLEQQAPGQLRLEYRVGKVTVSYSQAKGKCTLKVKAPEGGLTVQRRTFSAALQECPDPIRRRFVEAVEGYFDKVPGVFHSAAPPGKVVLHLKDGSVIVGEARLSTVRLETAFGRLDLPKDEIRQIIFPGAASYADAATASGGGSKASASEGETIVVMRRFSPRGTLDLDAFEVALPYGDLRIERADVQEAVFGPPVGESEAVSPRTSTSGGPPPEVSAPGAAK